SAALAVRGVVPVRSAYAASHRRHDQGRKSGPAKHRTMNSGPERCWRGLRPAPVRSPEFALRIFRALANIRRRVEPDPQDRPRIERDFLPLRRRDRSASADQDTEKRAADAADDAADDRADAGTGADPTDLTLDSLAFDRFRDRAAHRIRTSADGDLVERHGDLRTAVRARSGLHAADDAAEDGAGGDEHLVAAIEIGNGRRFEA